MVQGCCLQLIRYKTHHTASHLVKRKTADEMMAVKMGDRNQEMTTGVKPFRKGN